VTVLAANEGPAIAGEIHIKNNYPGETYAQSFNLPSQSQKRATIFVPFQGGTYTIELVNDRGKTLYRHDLSLRVIPQFSFLTGVISADPGLLNLLAGLKSSGFGDPLSVAHLSPTDLPEQAAALSAFDALIFNDVDTSGLTVAQQKALAEWVSSGGRLVVGGGPNVAVTTAGLTALLPVAALEIKTFPALVDLGAYVNRPVPDEGPYVAAVPKSATGVVDLYEQGQPFLVRRAVGRGSITYFALDFGLAPMNGWAGNESFWRKVLQPLQSTPPFYVNYNAPRSINDSLANISAAGLPSPGGFIAFVCLYFLALVPINYWVLKRFKRREWAWATIPALILLFTILGYIGGFRSRGGQSILRQLSVVWQDSGQTIASVDTFVGLYSPARDHYTLKFKPGTLVRPTDSGTGYKGVKQTSSAPTTIFYGSQTELRNLWTDVGSMSTALAHSQSVVQPITLRVRFTQRGKYISGTITNNSNQPLENARLLVGNDGLKLSTIPPGDTQLDGTLQPLNTQPYVDTTLWGENYAQLDDVQAQINDQILRGIFWPDTRGPGPQPASTTASETAILVGWQKNLPVDDDVEVVGHQVERNKTYLRIVSVPLENSQ